MDYKDFENMIFSYQKMNIEIPLPIEAVDYKKRWIQWGSDNLYPLYLIDLYNRSSLHSAIVKQKAMLIGGQGWDKSGLSDEAIEFLSNMNNDEDLDEILFKCSQDIEIFGNVALNIVWNREKTKIDQINYISPKNVRIAARAKDYQLEDKYWLCDDWMNVNRNPPVLFDGYSTINKQSCNQIFFYGEYSPGMEWYGIPEYISGVRWIEMEYEIGNYHLNNIKNGFYPQMHINLPYGNPPEDKKKEIVNRLKKQYKGTNNAGNEIVTFSEPNAENIVTFTPIDSNASDQLFLMLDESSTKHILKAHRINDAELFGESGKSIFTSKNQTMESMELLDAHYIAPKQKQLEKIFNRFRRVNKITDRLTIKDYEPKFSKINTNVSDILSILNSSLEPKIKYFILIKNDYDAKTASELTGYVDGQ